jgi:hypothetical protein
VDDGGVNCGIVGCRIVGCGIIGSGSVGDSTSLLAASVASVNCLQAVASLLFATSSDSIESLNKQGSFCYWIIGDTKQ